MADLEGVMQTYNKEGGKIYPYTVVDAIWDDSTGQTNHGGVVIADALKQQNVINLNQLSVYRADKENDAGEILYIYNNSTTNDNYLKISKDNDNKWSLSVNIEDISLSSTMGTTINAINVTKLKIANNLEVDGTINADGGVVVADSKTLKIGGTNGAELSYDSNKLAVTTALQTGGAITVKNSSSQSTTMSTVNGTTTGFSNAIQLNTSGTPIKLSYEIGDYLKVDKSIHTETTVWCKDVSAETVTCDTLSGTNLQLSGNLTVGGSLNFATSETTVLNGPLTFGSDVSIGGNLKVSNNLSVSGFSSGKTSIDTTQSLAPSSGQSVYYGCPIGTIVYKIYQNAQSTIELVSYGDWLVCNGVRFMTSSTSAIYQNLCQALHNVTLPDLHTTTSISGDTYHLYGMIKYR